MIAPSPTSTELKKGISGEIASPDKTRNRAHVTDSLTRMVLLVEYDGSSYCGSQLQLKMPTIQGELEKALARLTGEKIRVFTASRTDSGVHARGQVVSFRTSSTLSPQTFIDGLNHYLPPDIAVKAAHRVNDSFDVRRHALSREYSYYILNGATRSPLRQGFCHLVSARLDISAMNQASKALIGKHDFASFATRAGAEIKSTIRRVYQAEVKKDGELIVFKITANSFLPHQVRNTIGALIKVGLGKMTAKEFHSIIEEGMPGLAGATAPAHGLCLIKINYSSDF